MKHYLADLHIHSVLSPCGDLEMSPVNIVRQAVKSGLKIIAVTDHNHTGHGPLVREIGEENDIFVIYGVEVTTLEEVHCLAFFDRDDQIEALQEYIFENLPEIENDTDIFGHQLLVDRQERILCEVAYSLYPGIRKGITDVCEEVHRLGGIFVPAHVDRRMNGIYNQLGFLPEELDADAVEIFRNTDPGTLCAEHPELKKFRLLKSSDAHFLEDIGRSTSVFAMKKRSFSEFRKAIRGEQGREVTVI